MIKTEIVDSELSEIVAQEKVLNQKQSSEEMRFSFASSSSELPSDQENSGARNRYVQKIETSNQDKSEK